jgi:type II secretory pathway pseudopilin PulG
MTTRHLLRDSASIPRGKRKAEWDRSAFTLVELLVAATIAMGVMGAVATLFGIFSRTASTSQSILNMTSRMRSAGNALRQDLSGATAATTPPLNPEEAAGYFEIIEGPWTDSWNGSLNVPITAASSILGDTDDAVLLTTRRIGQPFVGRFGVSGTTIESHTAEVAWYCRPSSQTVDGMTLFTLYRRQLLVLPLIGTTPFLTGATATTGTMGTLFLGLSPAALSAAPSTPPIEPNCVSLSFTTNPPIWPATMWRDFYAGFGNPELAFDVSVRRATEDANQNSVLDSGEDTNSNGYLDNFMVPNSLADLTVRENRFWRHTLPNVLTQFPNRFLTGTNAPTFDGTDREGEDILLTNVISFDVRVFDPSAAPQITGSTVVYPGEPGFTASSAGTFSGCMLDLGQVPGAGTILSGPVAAKSQLSGTTATYDTWNTLYESNGINEDNDTEDLNGNGTLDTGEDRNGNGVLDNPLVDEGTNGLDDNLNGAPDDSAETETAPPYLIPLQSIEIRIRCYDSNSKEIRQVTVRHQFN